MGRTRDNVDHVGHSQLLVLSRAPGKLLLAPCTPWPNNSWLTAIRQILDVMVDGLTLPMTATSAERATVRNPHTPTLHEVDPVVHRLVTSSFDKAASLGTTMWVAVPAD